MQKIQLVKSILPLLLASAMLLPAGCSPKVDNGGYVQENPVKDQIVVGKSGREDVRTKLGSPSSQSSFGDETWYYVTARKESYAFMRPEVVTQEVVRIEFDKSGIVSKVETFNKEDGKEFDLVKRATPTEGHTLGFFEQVLGNIGRFNSPGGDNGVGTPGRRGGR